MLFDERTARNLSRGLRHERGYLLWMSACREGSLIQATLGSAAGGVGRLRNLSGFVVVVGESCLAERSGVGSDGR